MASIYEEAELKININGENAKKELQDLRTHLANLNVELDEARKKKDWGATKSLNKDILETRKRIREVQSETANLSEAIAHINTATPKELNKMLRDINAALNSGHVERGTRQWEEYTEAARRVKEEIKNVNEEMEYTGETLSDEFAKGMSKWWGTYEMGKDAVDAILGFANDKVSAFADMAEAMAQVTKYTGMTTEEVKSLNDAFKAMDTRTPREKLNALAGDAGRLGIQTQDAVLEFVDAADKINVALGDELGDDAVKNIGKLAMMFGEDKTMGLRGAMLATGSAINEVAQNCSAAEGFLVDFTARVAAAANQANISQADVIGFAASMDENMLRDEQAATAYQKIMMKMFTKTEAFAQAAGIEVEKFSKLLKSDANEAILQFAEGLSKKGGLADLAPIFGDLKTEGAGVSTVLSVLAGKAEEIRERQALANQAYKEGTSIINEFNVQNNTVKGGLEKAQKKAHDLAVELGERLQPIMADGLHLTSKLTKVLITLIDFTVQHQAGIIALAAAIGTLVAVVKICYAWEVARNAIQKVAITLKYLHTAALMQEVRGTEAATVALQNYNSKMLLGNKLFKAATIATQAYAAAKALLTGNIRACGVALKALWATLSINPVVAITAAVVALGLAIYAVCSRTTEADKAMKEFNKSNIKEQQELSKLYTAVKNANKGTKDRLDLINEFNQKYGNYLSKLLTEKSTVEELTRAYNEASLAIQSKMARQKMDEAETNVRNEHIDDKADAMVDLDDALKSALPQSTINKIKSKVISYVEEYLQKGVDVNVLRHSLTQQLHATYKQIGVADLSDADDALRKYIKEAKKEADELEEIHKKFSGLIVDAPGNNGNASGGSSAGTTPVINTGESDETEELETEKEKKKRIQAEIKAEDAKYYQEQQEIKQLYLDDQLESAEEYALLLEDAEMQHLQRKLGIMGLEPSEIEKIQDKILEAKIKFKEKCKKEDEDAAKEEKEAYLKNQEDKFSNQLIEAEKNHYKNMTSEEDYNNEVRQIKVDYYTQMANDQNLTDDQRQQYAKKVQEQEIEDLRDEYQKQQALQKKQQATMEKYKDAVKSVAEDYGTTLGEMIANGELNLKSFVKETLLMALDALEKVIDICIVEIEARNAAATAPLSFIGIAKAAAEAMALKAAFAVVKGVVSKNFYTGGYTGSGAWDEPQGVVHSNEFVANRFAVANPSVRPVLDLINAAQQQNTVSSLTAEDISKVLPAQQGGNVQSVQVIQTSDANMAEIVKGCITSLAKIQAKLEEPIQASVSITGKSGIEHQTSVYNSLKKNISR